MIKTELVELLSIEDVKEALIDNEVIGYFKENYICREVKITAVVEDNKLLCLYANSNEDSFFKDIKFLLDFDRCKVYCKKYRKINSCSINTDLKANKDWSNKIMLSSDGKSEFVKSKLKPCRWCGEIPFLDLYYSQASKIYVRIICNNDECPLESCYLEDMIVTKPGTQELLDFVEHCIEKWNN
jgi:hypothetical protein